MIELKTDVLRVKNADGTWQTIPALSPDVPVKGVQVAGTDLVPDADGKVDIPKANDYFKYGLVRMQFNTGLSPSGNYTYVSNASATGIDNRASLSINGYGAITPNVLNYAVKASLTDSNHLTMTADEQDTCCDVIGAVMDEQYELIETITLEENTLNISRTSEPNGTPYNFKNVLIWARPAIETTAGMAGINISDGINTIDNVTFQESFPTTLGASFVLNVYIEHGILLGDTYGATNDWSSSVNRTPTALFYNGIRTLNGIKSIVFQQLNGRKFISGSVFKIYAIRK